MRAHPDMIAGRNTFDTQVSVVTHGRVLSKRGGAALGCAKVGPDVGVVVKCGNGDSKTVPVLMCRALSILGLLQDSERPPLEQYALPSLHNCNGAVIGRVYPLF